MSLVDLSILIESINSFSTYQGISSKEVWILKITDLNNGNTGVLQSWILINSEHMVPKPNHIQKICV